MAAEISSSSPELRAFVVIGSYVQTTKGARRPSNYLNQEQDNLRFWLRKYEAKKQDIEMDIDIREEDLFNSIYLKDIENISQLEEELGKYLQDFTLLKSAWEVDHPIP